VEYLFQFFFCLRVDEIYLFFDFLFFAIKVFFGDLFDFFARRAKIKKLK